MRILLKCPHLRVAEGLLGWMTIVYIWVSNEPTLTVAVGANHSQNDEDVSFWGMDFQDGYRNGFFTKMPFDMKTSPRSL